MVSAPLSFLSSSTSSFPTVTLAPTSFAMMISAAASEPTAADNNKMPFHLAFGVRNIKNSIPLMLDQTDDRYASWVELFHIHVCAYNVLDHIDPKTPTPFEIDKAIWTRLDAIVKQWIYSTISTDVLQTIMKPGATAQQLWKRLEEIFQDNKATRAVCPSIWKNSSLILVLILSPMSPITALH